MIIGILGAGGHAKSIYDIVKKKKIYFFDEKKKNLKLAIKPIISLTKMT